MFGKLLGKIISAPVRIVNAPLRAMENLVDDSYREDERIVSKPLEELAKEIERLLDDEQ